MDLDENILYTREEKLSYVIKSLNLKTNEIADTLEISTSLVSQIQNYYNNKLKKIHLYAFASAYNIPMEIFENSQIDTSKKIDNLMQSFSLREIFSANQDILSKLVGKWYLYSYTSSPYEENVWSTETHIYENFSVIDVHKNVGQLYIGQNQSLIIKESHNSKNITTTVFDNARITYGNFPFSRISKSNALNREIFNFGFFSREEMRKERAKEILGNINKVQLQMDHRMMDRIASSIKIKG